MSIRKPEADEKSTRPLPSGGDMPAEQAEHISRAAQQLSEVPDERRGSDTAVLTQGVQKAIIPGIQEGRLHEAEAGVPVEWHIGDLIMGLYEVTDVFSGGATAMVYKVFHRAWNMDLAVKSPRPSILKGAKGVENFEAEAQTWVNLGLHFHIVSCYYVRRLGGIPRLFAEYVNGGDLASWINKKILYQGGHETALARILDIAIQCAWGLQYAHARGLIHQDVKPANVLMTRDGMAKVTDFGLARARSSAYEELEQQGQGAILATCGGMTPAYCSPEQAEIIKQAQAKVPAAMRGKLTQLTDIWSWAAMVLEMFTGQITWVQGEHADAGFEEYRAAGAFDSSIPAMPEDLAGLLRRCLKLKLSARVQSMEEAAAALQSIYQKVTGREYSRPAPLTAEALADNLNNRAVSLIDLRQQDEAEQCWKSALKAQPHHPESTYNRGLLLWRSGRLNDEELIRMIDEVRQSGRADWKNDYLLGQIHFERGDCEEAIHALGAMPMDDFCRREVRDALSAAMEKIASSRKLAYTLKGHRNAVTSVCLSADACYALSGSGTQFAFSKEKDFTIRMWDIQAEQCLRIFEGHTGRVTSVCFSQDGQHALSGSADMTLKLWHAATGRCLRTFAGHTASVNAACLTRDGRYAASAGRDTTLRLWEVDTGKCLRTLEGHADKVTSVCCTHDGRHCVSGSDDTTAKLWEMATGRCLRTFEGHAAAVTSVSVCSAGLLVLSGSEDTTLKLWQADDGRCLRTFRGHDEKISSACLSPDGVYALSGGGEFLGREQAVKLWEVSSGRCLYTFKGHSGAVHSVCFSQDGRYALSGSEDMTLMLWQTALDEKPYLAPLMLSTLQDSKETVLAQIQHAHEVREARKALEQHAPAEAARHVRAARAQKGYSCSREAMRIWAELYARLPKKSLSGWWDEAMLKGHTDSVSTICLSADSSLCVSGSEDATLKLWEIKTGDCLCTCEGHTGAVYSACMTKNMQHILSGSGDAGIFLWSAASGRCLQAFKGHEGSVLSVCLSPDDQCVYSGSEDATIRLWDIATGQCLRVVRGHAYAVTSLCASPDGRLLLSGSRDTTIRLWGIETGRCLRIFEDRSSPVRSVCFSPDSRCALSGGDDSRLRLWDIETGRCLRTFKGHADKITSACFSHDSRFAFSGSEDKTIRLWDVESGTCLRIIEGHAYAITSIGLSCNDHVVFSGSRDKTIKLWSLDWELDEREASDWDEAARPHLETFLTLHMPCAGTLACDRASSGEELCNALTRKGKPAWADADCDDLMKALGYAGLGFLRREGVLKKLEEMAGSWSGPPPFKRAPDMEDDASAHESLAGPEAKKKGGRSRLMLDID